MKFVPIIAVFIFLSGCDRNSSEKTHDDHGAQGGEGAPAPLSSEALVALDLKLEPLSLTNFMAFETVQGELKLRPLGQRSVVAPFSGRVEQVLVQNGDAVEDKQPVVTIVRDSLPVGELTLTGGVLTPGAEELHETVADIQRAKGELEIAERELGRIRELNSPNDGVAVIPRQQVVELEYEKLRVEKELLVLENRLRLHGFGYDDAQTLMQGRSITSEQTRWKAALKANSLWNDRAESLWKIVSKSTQASAWSIGMMGELALRDQITPELLTWYRSDTNATASFAKMAGLLQAGTSVESLKRLQEDGGFDETMAVGVPEICTGWVLTNLAVQPGDRVEAGQVLLRLADMKNLNLVVHPVGQEVPLIQEAVRSQKPLGATPLVRDAGPSLQNLRIDRVIGDVDVEAWIAVTNRIVRQQGRVPLMEMLPGTRYVLEVPTEQWKTVWVLPVGALAEEGADTVVYVQNGDDFAPVKVSVRFRDDRIAVLDKQADLFPGDRVVVRNAFGLSLALSSRGGQVIDPHAGHNH